MCKHASSYDATIHAVNLYRLLLGDEAHIPSNYGTVEGTAQEVTMWHNPDEVSLSQAEMQKKDKVAPCKCSSKINICTRIKCDFKSRIPEGSCKLGLLCK